ncbi:MAG: thrombospondin type 3 repeat-containing protein [Patescibacteria group bacterium]|nr:thrombospondin type 3 repeat-containing protein [Patescibacteria group bacterium]
MRKLTIFLIIAIFLGLIVVIPQEEELSAFRYYKKIDGIDIKTPTVVAVPMSETLNSIPIFAVFNETEKTFEGFVIEDINQEEKVAIEISPENYQPMIDNDYITYFEFDFQENAPNRASLTLTSEKPILSSGVTLFLDKYVALPRTIKILIEDDNGNRKIVLAETELTSNTINFPPTVASKWIIELSYYQPLRITEFKLHQDNVFKETQRLIKFLAQPNHHYRIYYDPDRIIDIKTKEVGEIHREKNFILLSQVKIRKNEKYTVADSDKDKVPDMYDNCVLEPNPDQKDENRNGRGDSCDDFDYDGIINSKDNCPLLANRNQLDDDGDGIGNACDKEESRITERYSWLPWLIIIISAGIIISFFILGLKKTKKFK